jgi:hypothetical protein
LDADGMLGDGEHRMPTSQAAKLLVLIAHARTCPGHHLSRSHSEVKTSSTWSLSNCFDDVFIKQRGFSRFSWVIFSGVQVSQVPDVTYSRLLWKPARWK